MRSGRGKVETIALICAAFSASPSISEAGKKQDEPVQRFNSKKKFHLLQLQSLHACSIQKLRQDAQITQNPDLTKCCDKDLNYCWVDLLGR